MRTTFKMILIGILAILVVVTISSQSYVKKTSALFSPMYGIGSCPAGKVRDWVGICFDKSLAKACLTCAPGSAALVEKPSHTASEKAKNAAVIKAICHDLETKGGTGGSQLLASHLGPTKIQAMCPGIK